MPVELRGGDALAFEEQGSLMSARSIMPQPVSRGSLSLSGPLLYSADTCSLSSGQISQNTVTKLVKRVRLMILKLIPVEVNLEDITDATSSIVSPVVVAAFAQAGGDFSEAVPFALMQARAQFLKEARQSRRSFVCRMYRHDCGRLIVTSSRLSCGL
jgi:hypothetical protein